MKIVSSKPESQNPVINADSSNASSQPISDNLFLSLIMQSMMQTKLPVNPEAPQSATSELGEFTQTGDAPIGYDTQLFLAQLDKLDLQTSPNSMASQETVTNPEKMTEFENLPATHANPDKTFTESVDSVVKEIDKGKVVPQASTKAIRDITDNLDKKPSSQQPIEQDSTKAVRDITDNLNRESTSINQLSPLMTEETANQVTKQLQPREVKKDIDYKNLTSMSMSADLVRTDGKENLLADKIIKQKSVISPEIRQPKVEVTPAVFATTDLANSTTLSSLPLEQSYTPLSQENKYSDALLQLGQFINAQTMNAFSKNDQSMSINATTISSESDIATKHSASTDFTLQMELSPPTLDALNKETYDAKIKIYPPELGEVMATLKVDKNGAELFITTENNRVKEIVEANLPQLRESFQHAEINLTDIQVQTSSSGTKEQGNPNTHQKESFISREPVLESNNEQIVSPKESPKKSETLIDTYA
ncbi:MAG: flagellar hook-length control protein FliK [Gammaproteobacteria bacterium]